MSESLHATESRENESRLLYILLDNLSFTAQTFSLWAEKCSVMCPGFPGCSSLDELLPRHGAVGCTYWGQEGCQHTWCVLGLLCPCCIASVAQPRNPGPWPSISHLCPNRSAEAPWGAACHTAAGWTSLRSGHFWCATCTLWRWSLKVGASYSLGAARKTGDHQFWSVRSPLQVFLNLSSLFFIFFQILF